MFVFSSHEPRLNELVAASTPGLLLGRTQCAWRYGRASSVQLKEDRIVSYFILFQMTWRRNILLLRKSNKKLRTKSVVGKQNSKED